MITPIPTAANKAVCPPWANENPYPYKTPPNTPVTISVTKSGTEVERYTFKNAWLKFCGGVKGQPYTVSMLYSGGTHMSQAKAPAIWKAGGR